MANRRDFLSTAAVLMSGGAMRYARGSVSGPEIALTFDDPKTQKVGAFRWQDVTEQTLRALAKHKIKSVLFVCGMRVDGDTGHELIEAWDREGHLIANHSYSHLDLDSVTLQAFEADTLRNEPLIVSYRNFARLFRYPYFKEGKHR